jgi:hypothetical protein
MEAAAWDAGLDVAGLVYGGRVNGESYECISAVLGVSASSARRLLQRYECFQNRGGSCNHTCGACGEPFDSSRSDARYCSNACRQDAYRKRKQGFAT